MSFEIYIYLPGDINSWWSEAFDIPPAGSLDQVSQFLVFHGKKCCRGKAWPIGDLFFCDPEVIDDLHLKKDRKVIAIAKFIVKTRMKWINSKTASNVFQVLRFKKNLMLLLAWLEWIDFSAHWYYFSDFYQWLHKSMKKDRPKDCDCVAAIGIGSQRIF